MRKQDPESSQALVVHQSVLVRAVGDSSGVQYPRSTLRGDNTSLPASSCWSLFRPVTIHTGGTLQSKPGDLGDTGMVFGSLIKLTAVRR